MSKFILKLLSESSDVSTMRLMSLFSLLIGAVIGLYGVYMAKDLSGVAQVCGVFVASAFVAKTGQKLIESKKE